MLKKLSRFGTNVGAALGVPSSVLRQKGTAIADQFGLMFGLNGDGSSRFARMTMHGPVPVRRIAGGVLSPHGFLATRAGKSGSVAAHKRAARKRANVKLNKQRHR